jgi:DNA-binding MarR family transcriptional regulator
MPVTLRVTLEERLLLHLLERGSCKISREASKAISQEGICQALSIKQPQVAKIAKILVRKGLIGSKRAFVEGAPRTRNIYFLTSKGQIVAKMIRKAIA